VSFSIPFVENVILHILPLFSAIHQLLQDFLQLKGQNKIPFAEKVHIMRSCVCFKHADHQMSMI